MVAQVIHFASRIFTPFWFSGPIFEKELRVISRRRRHYLLRCAYLALLSLFVIIAWINTVDYGQSSASSIYKMADAGKWIVGTICWFQFITIPLIAVILMSTSISDEVYHGTLDEVIGMIHIKDVLRTLESANGGKRRGGLRKLVRTVMFVAPSMRVLDLLLQMRKGRIHMALVVDEYGGIDGLVTIEDLVEEIVGEIEEEHEAAAAPRLETNADGTLIVDARLPMEEFEARVGPVLAGTEDAGDVDTLGGFVSVLAGRVPPARHHSCIPQVSLAPSQTSILRYSCSALNPAPVGQQA